MQIKLLVEGGAMAPGPALSQQLGPAGINIGQVISKVNDATKGFKGMKVPVELDIDMKTKGFEVTVSSPPVSELLKKELGITKGSATQTKMQVANASIEQIINVAKQKMDGLLAKDLKAAVKSVIGTCTSLGILVENKPSSELGNDVDEGKYDKEIQAEATETPAEKKKELDAFFKQVQSEQEKLLKQEEAEKAAEAEAKEAAPAEGTAEGAAEGTNGEAAKPEEPAKK